MRRIALPCVLIAVLLAGFACWRYFSAGQVRATSAPVVTKLPPTFALHTFYPAAPPADMPPLGEGEEAECDSNFVSNASVSGELRKIDSTHATAIVTQVKVTLELKINIWVPNGATQHVIEHEQGHRQISEHYYQEAEKVANRIAETYLGRTISIAGDHLDADFAKTLRQLSATLTADYNDKLTPGPAQQKYDDLTDHSRNDVSASDAVAQALSETALSVR